MGLLGRVCLRAMHRLMGWVGMDRRTGVWGRRLDGRPIVWVPVVVTFIAVVVVLAFLIAIVSLVIVVVIVIIIIVVFVLTRLVWVPGRMVCLRRTTATTTDGLSASLIGLRVVLTRALLRMSTTASLLRVGLGIPGRV